MGGVTVRMSCMANTDNLNICSSCLALVLFKGGNCADMVSLKYV